ncbi:hypothetical protein G7047_11485 [Diaphorobacter sp. HDW4A]|uniref:hypothetical protein n=1 Tax=Diaphorobacter sp. HDW4A TaxID=2714924 RepID=UPI00140D5864|nr:hypothetical protein [Diaphorobacter sp. HDW4A]QIL80453.1 hypothetical protein G7047_11485 [Diaphorobacter sp. HDW4A]
MSVLNTPVPHSDTPQTSTWRAAWAGALASLRAPFDTSSDELDRQRMRDVNAQAFTAIDALLLTDFSPVSFLLDRCCSDCDCES